MQPTAGRRTMVQSTLAPSVTLEERNLRVLKGSFLFAAFNEVKQQQTEAGVAYVFDSMKTLRNAELRLVSTLPQGFGQFFDEDVSWVSRSFFVAAEGFFYSLTVEPAVCSNKRFITPVFCVKAPSRCSSDGPKMRAQICFVFALFVHNAMNAVSLGSGSRCQSPIKRPCQGQCIKGDFVTDDFHARHKKEITIGWTGSGPEDFGLVWDGFFLDARLRYVLFKPTLLR